MNVIDQVILIPMSPEKIWRFVGDIRLNPKWQVDCADFSLLNNIEAAPGMRWRYTHGGRAYIVEVSAWYNRLGYEYIIVDGAPFNNSKGRIRLQEIPEGTLVQWTFQYETSGMLGGLRNVGIKRSLDKEIEEGLRNLYQYIMEHAGEVEEHQAKSLMQDAPAYEERSQYQSRYPTTIAEEPAQPAAPQQTRLPSEPQPMASFELDEPEIPSEPQPAFQPAQSIIPEPPIDDDDTRPNPAIQSRDDEPLPEPDFIDNVPPLLFEAPAESSPKPKVPQPVNEPELSFTEPPTAPPLASELSATITEPKKSDIPLSEPEKSFEAPEVVANQPTSSPDEESAPNVDPFEEETPSTDASDTSRISVFEVFGMQKPSETQEMRAVPSEEKAEEVIEEKFATIESQKIEPVKATVETEAASVEPKPPAPETDSTSGLEPGVVYDVRRTGLRFVQRQKRVILRRPE
jgi:hypothetical protein